MDGKSGTFYITIIIMRVDFTAIRTFLGLVQLEMKKKTPIESNSFHILTQL